MMLRLLLAGCLCCLVWQQTTAQTVVKVVFREDDRPEDKNSDTLFYHQRASSAEDYRGRPPSSPKSEAVSFTSFAFDGSSRRFRDTLEITLVLQVFWVKSSSWLRSRPPSQHTLEHEQIHFDITRLVAEGFRKKVQEMELTMDDHDSRIQYEYLESFREMNRRQEEFDDAVRSGLDVAGQRAWREKIRNALLEAGVRPADPQNF
jgi:hypothetical protein